MFMDALVIADPGRTACMQALGSDGPDFQDGIARATTGREGCGFIASRDKAAFSTSPVPRTSAAGYLAGRRP